MDDVEIEKHVLNINENGYTIIKNGIDNKDLIDRIICDFESWASKDENNFKKGQFNRVTNFHFYNNDTLDLVTNKAVNSVLSKYFNSEQVVYSSLFFREGTAQHYHRDTPHFYTNPIDNYCGVWFALEDVNVNAGPLKYYIGSQKLEVPNGHETFNRLFGESSETKENMSYSEKNLACLLEYNKHIENLCEKENLMKNDETNYLNPISKGDIIIWHPKLLHGGSEIIDKNLTRYSMVTHNVPINKKVFNASHFFTSEPTNEYLENLCDFTYVTHNNVSLVSHSKKEEVQRNYL